MSLEPEALEITRQSSPVNQDMNYIKLRLDTQQLHKDILNFLQGTTTMLTFNEEVNSFVEVQAAKGEPLANEKGIQAILSFVVSVINPHTIQGNTKREEYYKILKVTELQMAEWLTLNYDDWGISPSNRNLIIDTVMTSIQLILSRTIDNYERKSYSGGIEKVSQIYQDKKNNKVM